MDIKEVYNQFSDLFEKFDLIIYPMANIFSTTFYKGLPKLTGIIKQFKIEIQKKPTFI